MATNPLVPPKFRALDANGDPLAGGLLYSYEAGTTTPLATYTTRAGNVANANPVVLDANGEANVWLAQGVDYKLELRNSAGVVQWTVDNVPSPEEVDTSSDSLVEPGGRLTLTSGTPVTTTDVTTATTVYYAPYRHNKVPLYDGTTWQTHVLASELSQSTSDTTKSPAAVANNTNYDMFVWDDNGTLRVSRGPAWSSATSRGTGSGTTELELLNGRHVNKYSISNGPQAQRGLYVGSVRSNGSARIVDSAAIRWVWNKYNRVRRHMLLNGEAGGAASYNYTTATYRQANANTGNQLDVLVGLDEDAVQVTVATAFYNASARALVIASIGLDSTSTPATGVLNSGSVSQVNSVVNQARATWEGLVGVGRHTLVWLEYSEASGTTTWQTQLAGQVGMSGAIWS